MWKEFGTAVPSAGEVVIIENTEGRFVLIQLPTGNRIMVEIKESHQCGFGRFYLLNHLIRQEARWKPGEVQLDDPDAINTKTTERN